MSLLPRPYSHLLQPHSRLFSSLHEGTFYYQGHWTVPSSPLSEFATKLQPQAHLLLFGLSEEGALVINILSDKEVVEWLKTRLWAGCVFRFISTDSYSLHGLASETSSPLYFQSSRATYFDETPSFNHSTHVCYLTLREDVLPISNLNLIEKSLSTLSVVSPKSKVREARKQGGDGIDFVRGNDPVGIVFRQMVEKRIWELEKPSEIEDDSNYIGVEPYFSSEK